MAGSDDRADALVIGAGPAGASSAIWLAKAGWDVAIVEQHAFPRHKVCGECIAAGALEQLDALGIGTQIRDLAGPLLRQVGWMSASASLVADLPPCTAGPYPFGRALGRDQLDTLLLVRAKALGVRVLQPAKVRSVHGGPARFTCEIEPRDGSRAIRALDARVVIDAHGSWEDGPQQHSRGPLPAVRRPPRASDLFAFKATFLDGALAEGVLPVLAFEGGYGGIVVSDHGRTTLACCVRRDRLRDCRAAAPGLPAGEAVEAYLRRSCRGVRDALIGAHRHGAWLSVGPLRPGANPAGMDGPFRVGNAAGESHPLIGEGISMALQSAALLTGVLTQQPAAAIDARVARTLHQAYANAWRTEFTSRLRYASAYAHLAMRPVFTAPARSMLRRWPGLLTIAAHLAGKDRAARFRPEFSEETS